MSVIPDEIFSTKLNQLKALKNEIDQDRNEIYTVLGEWLVNALNDDNNKELRELFISGYDNTKYLSKKKQREMIKPIADRTAIKLKTTASNFDAPSSKNDDQDNLNFDNSNE